VQAGAFATPALDTPLTIAVVPLEVIESQQRWYLRCLAKHGGRHELANQSDGLQPHLIRGIAVDNRANYG